MAMTNKALNVPHLRFPEFSEFSLTDSAVETSFFIRTKTKVVDKRKYISTENMLQDFVGILEYETGPEIKGIGFKKGDILISNIRPYLRKVWCASFDGACSSDVIVLSPKTRNLWWFYLIANDRFINYSMTGVKGLKMPRGDKEHIKKFSFHVPGVTEQEKISLFFEALDYRIKTQKKIIEDCKKEYANARRIFFRGTPLHIEQLSTLYKTGKAGGTPKSTIKSYYSGSIPFLGIADITSQGKYIFETSKHISKDGLKNSSAWLVPKNSIILSMYASVGFPTINKIELATSQAMFSMSLKEDTLVDYIYEYLLFYKDSVLPKYIETGTQGNINADHVRQIKIPFYSNDRTVAFCHLMNCFVERGENSEKELNRLQKLKRYLLSNLFI